MVSQELESDAANINSNTDAPVLPDIMLSCRTDIIKKINII